MSKAVSHPPTFIQSFEHSRSFTGPSCSSVRTERSLKTEQWEDQDKWTLPIMQILLLKWSQFALHDPSHPSIKEHSHMQHGQRPLRVQCHAEGDLQPQTLGLEDDACIQRSLRARLQEVNDVCRV